MILTQHVQPIINASTAVSTDVQEAKEIAVEETVEEMWKVVAHDDSRTTMEFVVRVMVQIFQKPLIFAEAIMWQIHTEGNSVVDVLPKTEAELRKNKAIAAARLEGFPFKVTIEPA